MRSMKNDHGRGIEWEWLQSMLHPKEGNSTVSASPELLAKAQQQVSKKKFMMTCRIAAIEVYHEGILNNFLEALPLLLIVIMVTIITAIIVPIITSLLAKRHQLRVIDRPHVSA